MSPRGGSAPIAQDKPTPPTTPSVMAHIHVFGVALGFLSPLMETSILQQPDYYGLVVFFSPYLISKVHLTEAMSWQEVGSCQNPGLRCIHATVSQFLLESSGQRNQVSDQDTVFTGPRTKTGYLKKQKKRILRSVFTPKKNPVSPLVHQSGDVSTDI